ncbi:hypothetical protein P168DRAFT_281612 [Aspergillus campestris IBT 28561]|uniref:Uncharacterized protein n=1 Tax=Aspergillus campestris (strain IBT 28561) TaxID=1392248 RepID=A0A2I1D5Z2_ASPC2|nr:uncharacterized protein P168DRAFT_281612 [Aspergillus campestris IBT 28561]PKY05290.1 hypothetical protein P168DRAFT_281612 [Aspergillus campestris IBT 28561]
MYPTIRSLTFVRASIFDTMTNLRILLGPSPVVLRLSSVLPTYLPTVLPTYRVKSEYSLYLLHLGRQIEPTAVMSTLRGSNWTRLDWTGLLCSCSIHCVMVEGGKTILE